MFAQVIIAKERRVGSREGFHSVSISRSWASQFPRLGEELPTAQPVADTVDVLHRMVATPSSSQSALPPPVVVGNLMDERRLGEASTRTCPAASHTPVNS